MGAVEGNAFKLSYAGQDITAYVNKTGTTQQGDKLDASRGNAKSKQYVPGLLDGTTPVEGPFDPAVHAILAPLMNTQNALVYQPVGAASGMPRATVQALLTDYEVSSDVTGLTSIKATLQFSGDLVWDTNP